MNLQEDELPLEPTDDERRAAIEAVLNLQEDELPLERVAPLNEPMDLTIVLNLQEDELPLELGSDLGRIAQQKLF